MTTNTSAVVLNVDYITEVMWWEHPDFEKRYILEAAELVAFDVLDPALRSRGGIQEKSKRHYEDAVFRDEMIALFSGEPTGFLKIPSLQACHATQKLILMHQIQNRSS